MKIINISQNIASEMVCYPGLSNFNSTWARTYEKDMIRLSEISMATHVGTHIEAPYHLLEDGSKLDESDLGVFYGKAEVIDLSFVEQKITKETVTKYINAKADKILLKTKNSSLFNHDSFRRDYVYIDGDAARLLVKRNIHLIGFDYASVDKYKDKHKKTHKILFSNNIVILENINLNGVSPGQYILACFPLHIEAIEASPCRAVLIKTD